MVLPKFTSPVPAALIHTIHVSFRKRFERSLFDRSKHKFGTLGYVTRYGDVVEALARTVDVPACGIPPANVAGLEKQTSTFSYRSTMGIRAYVAGSNPCDGVLVLVT